MRNVSYFPPYSQPENVVTNAVLLLLSHVNRLAPDLFSDLLTNLTDESFDVGPIFQNQIKIKGGKGIPDALIRQVPFEIYVETKLGDKLAHSQIEDHFITIKAHETVPGSSILLGLTRSKLSEAEISKLRAMGAKRNVRFFVTTFSDLADFLEYASSDFRQGLNKVVEEYRAFIQEQGLTPVSLNRLIINPCGTSYEQNKRHNIYHDQPGRSKVFCKYLGIYRDKAVSMIGRVRAVMTARIIGENVEVIDNFSLPWESESPFELTEEWERRILNIVDGSHYYNLRDEEARYYLVDKFVETDFRKVSKYGIQGHRYFTLDSRETGAYGAVPELFSDREPSIDKLADELRNLTWR